MSIEGYIITHIVCYRNDETEGTPTTFTFTFSNAERAWRWKEDMNSLIDRVNKVAESGSQLQAWRIWLLQYEEVLDEWQMKMLPELTQMADDAQELIDEVPTKLYMRQALQDYVPPTEEERKEFIKRWTIIRRQGYLGSPVQCQFF